MHVQIADKLIPFQNKQPEGEGEVEDAGEDEGEGADADAGEDEDKLRLRKAWLLTPSLKQLST